MLDRPLLKLALATMVVVVPVRPQPPSCPSGSNPIVCENLLPGTPSEQWDTCVRDNGTTSCGVGDPSIQGFATDISVNRGGTIHFKVKTDATAWHIDIYRIGYYSGLGARQIAANILPSVAALQNQPSCLRNATGLIDCGNWDESASWDVPATATSGVYLAKLTRENPLGSSQIIFIVRDDSSTSDILFQTSDLTWQAYNTYGDDPDPAIPGNSLYSGSNGPGPMGAAYKVSYNRPFNTRSDNMFSWIFSEEYPMIRWLERNGYDVSYFSGVDTDRYGSQLLSHKVFLSVGHDEYWSDQQRTNVETARANGINLAFFSGNEIFWKTRWENSIDGSNTDHRTLVCYKETNSDLTQVKIDPDPAWTWTGTWRDPSYSPPSDGGRPENAVSGTISMVEGSVFDEVKGDYRLQYNSMAIPPAYGSLRIWRNTDIPVLAALGMTKEITNGSCKCLLGYEWDEDIDNGFRPLGLIDLSSSTAYVERLLKNYGTVDGPGTATHHLTMYRHPSGAFVFSAGTVNWAWGLDFDHDYPANLPAPAAEIDIQQATVNLLADMHVQPQTLESGLFGAVPSSDGTPPGSLITSPGSGASLAIASPVSVTGTATDAGGIVAGIEVSVDGGATWHPAVGTGTWSYSWIPNVMGTVVIKSRAVDDSGNIENTSSGTTVTIVPQSTHILLFYNSSTGANAIAALDNAGGLTTLSSGFFSTGWTHIVRASNNIVLFYDASTGHAATGRLDDTGSYVDLVAYNWSGGWTHIIAVNDFLLFYNSVTGQRVIGRVDSAGVYDDLSAGLFSSGWTSIVATTNNVVLFYRADTGQAATGTITTIGGYTGLQIVGGLSSGWTEIVPGVNNVLLFYNAATGYHATGTLDASGNFFNDAAGLGFSTGWTSIAAGITNTVLLFYRSDTGLAASGRLDSSGTYSDLLTLGGISAGWTQIVPR